MTDLVADRRLVAACGLYCGACRSYLKGRCPGCRANEKASWCKVRSCCLEAARATCADCAEFEDPNACRKFDNPVSKVFGFLFNSNRRACILEIRERGPEAFAATMAEQQRQSLPRRNRG